MALVIRTGLAQAGAAEGAAAQSSLPLAMVHALGNDTFVVEEDDGTSQLGTYLRTIRTYAPTGTSADVTAIHSLLDEMSGVGEVRLRGGSAVLASPLYIPSRSVLVLNPGTSLVSTIPEPGSPDPSQSPIQVALPVADGASTTVHTTAVVGTRTLITVGPIAVGKTITFGNGAANIVQQATVVATSGSGPYTLTLDEQIWAAHAPGDAVIPYTLPTDIEVWGCGALLTGTGGNGVEIAKGNRVAVRNLRIGPDDGSFKSIGFSYDLGCRDCIAEDLTINNDAYTQVGFSHESTTRCRAIRIHSSRAAGNESIWFSISWAGSAEDCTTHADALHGILIEGANCAFTLRGGEVYNPSGSGVIVNASDVTIDGVTAIKSDRGFRILTGVSDRVTLTGCHAYACLNSGYQFDIGSNTMVGCTAGSGAQFDVWCTGGKTQISGFVATGCAASSVLASGAGTYLSVADSVITLGGAVGAYGVATGYPSAGARVDCNGVTVYAVGASSIGFGTTAATDRMDIRNCRVLSGGKGFDGAAGTFSRLHNNDFHSATTPITSAGTTNFGSATLVGGTVTVANTLLKSTDRIKLTKRTAGGTEGFPRISAITASTSFVITSSSGTDTSTFEWEF